MNSSPIDVLLPAHETHMKRFATHGQASAALAATVAADLENAFEERGAASLAVPGGTTPGEFMSMLAQRDLDWPWITVTLTDERWVPPTDERSNAGLVARTLGLSPRPYQWWPMWREDCSPQQAAGQLEAESRSMPWPLDVVVLGMGEDGHVASLFPGDESGFDARRRCRFVAVKGPTGEPRVSLSAAAIVEAGHVYLLLKGEAKQARLAAATDRLPVARILAMREGPTTVFASD
jgi:6-phosphogluconolactonase